MGSRVFVAADLLKRGSGRINEWTLTGLARPRYAGPAVWTLLDDLDAFYLEHRHCGELAGNVMDGRVWMTCEGSAGLSRSSLLGLMRYDEPTHE
jgi:hypothetical protein